MGYALASHNENILLIAKAREIVTPEGKVLPQWYHHRD